jgi:hypothetical protein
LIDNARPSVSLRHDQMKMFLLSLALIGSNVAIALSDTITVTTTNDSGPGSLRQAIADAAPGDMINFDLPAPSIIGLTTDELLINKSLTISGPGPTSLTVEFLNGGSFGPRVMEIAAGELDVTITGLAITNGSAFAEGDGLLNHSTGAVNIQDCVFDSNFGALGGGVANEGNLNLTDCTVSNNIVSGGESGGGGVYNNGTMTIARCTISGNDADGLAGGPPIIAGAGILNYGMLTLVNSTVSGNDTSKGYGGGIANAKGSITITNCTIADNSAAVGSGGGIFNASGNEAGEIHIKNSIIAANSNGSEPPFDSETDIDGAVNSDGHNLIGSDFEAIITPTTGDQVGPAESPIDPLLGPLQDNGGPTETQALLHGSPAIDKGAAADGVTTDQRCRFRPVDAVAIPPAEAGDDSDIGAFEKQADQSLNISTRLQVLTGENILDAGFIISGTDPKRVLVRGIGPSLAQAMLPGFLVDPVLELHDSTEVLLTNDNWKDSQEAEIEATNLAPSDDAESALVTTLDPGAYTAILSGKSGGIGIGLVEVYDLDSAANSTLGNTSTRGFVATGDNVMISGFILGAGEGPMDQIIVRALGPSLESTGITNPLEDPSLELHDGDGALLASNDNWRDTQEGEIEATGLAPTDDREAAIVQTLPAGPYTAIVRGVDQTSGVALVEVFDLH